MARSPAEHRVADLLRSARAALGLSVTFLSRMDGVTQRYQVVDSGVPLLFPEGSERPQATSFCQAILEGRLPAVMPDVRRFPEAMALPAARFPRLRSYVSVPVRLSDGTVYGTFGAAGLTTDRSLSERDRAYLELLAATAAEALEPGVLEARHRAAVEARLRPLLAGGGPVVVMQPIVDLRSGRRAGAEALSRFPVDWDRGPAVVFEEAHGVGLGVELELRALRLAVDRLDVDGYVSMNVSARTLRTEACADLLHRLPVERIVLEVSEHEQVDDPGALRDALAGARAAGLRLAVDDVVGGYPSLRNLSQVAPDLIKLDRSIITRVGAERARRAVVTSVVDFARAGGARVVAEGIETAEDAEVCLELGVDLGQGWFFGRPGPPSGLSPIAGLLPDEAGGRQARRPVALGTVRSPVRTTL